MVMHTNDLITTYAITKQGEKGDFDLGHPQNGYLPRDWFYLALPLIRFRDSSCNDLKIGV